MLLDESISDHTTLSVSRDPASTTRTTALTTTFARDRARDCTTTTAETDEAGRRLAAAIVVWIPTHVPPTRRPATSPSDVPTGRETACGSSRRRTTRSIPTTRITVATKLSAVSQIPVNHQRAERDQPRGNSSRNFAPKLMVRPLPLTARTTTHPATIILAGCVSWISTGHVRGFPLSSR